MNRDTFQRIGKLPTGLTIAQCASRLRLSYFTARRWLLHARYRYTVARRRPRSESWKLNASMVNWSKINWTLPDAEIARQAGVSRQRINKYRNHNEKNNAISTGRRVLGTGRGNS